MSLFSWTLFEDFDLKGEWWLPQEPDKRVAGTLSVSQDGLLLEILAPGTGANPLLNRPQFNPEIILGLTREGVPCTLYKSMQTSSEITFGGLHNAEYSPQFLFVFEHFNSPSDMRFQQASLSYTHLEEWIGDLPFETKHLGEKSFEGITATVHTKDEFKAQVPNLDATFSVFHSIGKSGDGIRRLELKHTAFLIITPKGLRTFEWYQDITSGSRDLLALLIGESVHPRQVRLWLERKEANEAPPRKKMVEVYFRQPRKPQNENLHPREIIVPLDKIRDNVGDILEAFFAKRANLRPVYELLLGTYYNPTMYARFQFLSLMQALETFHRRTYTSSGYIPKPHYKKLRELLTPLIDKAFETFRRLLPT